MAAIPDDVKAKARAAVAEAHSSNVPTPQPAPTINPDTKFGQEAEKAQTVNYQAPEQPQPQQEPDKG